MLLPTSPTARKSFCTRNRTVSSTLLEVAVAAAPLSTAGAAGLTTT